MFPAPNEPVAACMQGDHGPYGPFSVRLGLICVLLINASTLEAPLRLAPFPRPGLRPGPAAAQMACERAGPIRKPAYRAPRATVRCGRGRSAESQRRAAAVGPVPRCDCVAQTLRADSPWTCGGRLNAEGGQLRS